MTQGKKAWDWIEANGAKFDGGRLLQHNTGLTVRDLEAACGKGALQAAYINQYKKIGKTEYRPFPYAQGKAYEDPGLPDDVIWVQHGACG